MTVIAKGADEDLRNYGVNFRLVAVIITGRVRFTFRCGLWNAPCAYLPCFPFLFSFYETRFRVIFDNDVRMIYIWITMSI